MAQATFPRVNPETTKQVHRRSQSRCLPRRVWTTLYWANILHETQDKYLLKVSWTKFLYSFCSVIFSFFSIWTQHNRCNWVGVQVFAQGWFVLIKYLTETLWSRERILTIATEWLYSSEISNSEIEISEFLQTSQNSPWHLWRNL